MVLKPMKIMGYLPYQHGDRTVILTWMLACQFLFSTCKSKQFFQKLIAEHKNMQKSQINRPFPIFQCYFSSTKKKPRVLEMLGEVFQPFQCESIPIRNKVPGGSYFGTGHITVRFPSLEKLLPQELGGRNCSHN